MTGALPPEERSPHKLRRHQRANREEASQRARRRGGGGEARRARAVRGELLLALLEEGLGARPRGLRRDRARRSRRSAAGTASHELPRPASLQKEGGPRSLGAYRLRLQRLDERLPKGVGTRGSRVSGAACASPEEAVGDFCGFPRTW